MSQALSDRYAASPAWRRPVTIAGVVALAAVALVWLAWATFVQSTPQVESQLVGWRVVDDHTTTVRVDVSVSHQARHPRCTLQALASDHSIVGEKVFTPVSGTNEVTLRTERRASAVDLPGCITDAQDHPR